MPAPDQAGGERPPENDGGVHTIPAPTGRGWWNVQNGKVLSRLRYQELAVEAGRATAIKLGAEHVIHGEDGEVAERTSHDSASGR